eukprot:3932037-Rhodomonas_salina.4
MRGCVSGWLQRADFVRDPRDEGVRGVCGRRVPPVFALRVHAQPRDLRRRLGQAGPDRVLDRAQLLGQLLGLHAPPPGLSFFSWASCWELTEGVCHAVCAQARTAFSGSGCTR